jgi:hypothetical protein
VRKGRIEKYLDNVFGLGGASNYERRTINEALKFLTSFYSDNFGYAERESLLKFLNRMERQDKNCNARLDELQTESEYLREYLE